MIGSDGTRASRFPGRGDLARAVVRAVVEVVGSRRIAEVGSGPWLVATPPSGVVWSRLGPWDDETADVLGTADLVVCNGDPNYWAVTRILRRALDARLPGTEPVIVVRHTEWPAARRDHYLAPDRLPEEAKHPSSQQLGVRRGVAVPVNGGLRGPAGSAWALREGGRANGVRTAVDDFLAAWSGYECRDVPVDFGVSVLVPRGHPSALALARRMTGWTNDELLVAQSARYLDLLEELSELEHTGQTGEVGRRLRGENARLRERVDELERILAEIRDEADALAYSAVLRAVEFVERPARRTRPGPTFGSRLRQIADRARCGIADRSDRGHPDG